MSLFSKIMVGIIAAMHVYFAYAEMFNWPDMGSRFFPDKPKEFFEDAAVSVMAANQGVYNLFLAAGLIWSLLIKDAHWARNIATCFVLFVATAGIFGALTGLTLTLVAQTVPAAIALLLLVLRR